MFTQTCENKHTIGFRRDESFGEGWYTLRCIQCGGQQLVPMKCPFCGNKGVHAWYNDSKKSLLLLQCARCNKWINNGDFNKGVFKDVVKMLPFLILASILMTGLILLLPSLGVDKQTSTIIASVLGFVVIGIAIWFRQTR